MREISHIIHRKDQPHAKKNGDHANEIMVLFNANLTAMRDWYHQQPAQGQELGHLVILELSLSHVILALSDALEGKTWLPPK